MHAIWIAFSDRGNIRVELSCSIHINIPAFLANVESGSDPILSSISGLGPGASSPSMSFSEVDSSAFCCRQRANGDHHARLKPTPRDFTLIFGPEELFEFRASWGIGWVAGSADVMEGSVAAEDMGAVFPRGLSTNTARTASTILLIRSLQITLASSASSACPS